MRVKHDGLMLCEDCMSLHETGDETSFDYYYGQAAGIRIKQVKRGLERLGRHLVADWDGDTWDGVEEFSWRGCDCCGTSLGGKRYRYSVLEEEGGA